MAHHIELGELGKRRVALRGKYFSTIGMVYRHIGGGKRNASATGTDFRRLPAYDLLKRLGKPADLVSGALFGDRDEQILFHARIVAAQREAGGEAELDHASRALAGIDGQLVW